MILDRGEPSSRGLRVVPRPSPFADFVYVVATGEGLDIPDGPGEPPSCVHFSGLGLVGRELHSSAQDLSERLKTGRLTLADVLSGTGCFTAVLKDRGELLFVTDFAGLEHLYVYDGPRGAIISNRLHALIAHLKAAGIERKLNETYAAPALWSHHAFYRQCHSHHLAVKGLSLVPMDRLIAVTDTKVVLKQKPVLARAFGGVEASYDSLLDEAAHEILASVAVVGDSGRFDHVSTDLSGGRDSRVVFGALLKLGRVSTTPTSTKDVPGTRDLRHALRIVEHYQAPFYTGDPDGPEILAESAENALGQWRSYYMGMYHKLWLSPWSIRGAPSRSVKLYGGCGEMYRSFWSNWLSPVLAEAKPADTIPVVFERILQAYPEAHRSAAAAAFADDILSLPGDSSVEKLDNHYLFFRGRTHFGMLAQRFQNAGPAWPPLVSPALFLASRKLSWEERHTGRVLFDILDRIAPELNFFKYDGDPWPAEFLKASRWKGPRKLGADFDREAMEGRWKAAQVEEGRVNAARRRGAARLFNIPEVRPMARAAASDALERLLSSSPELAAILGPTFHAGMMERFDRANEKHWLILTSKMLSLSDLVLD